MKNLIDIQAETQRLVNQAKKLNECIQDDKIEKELKTLIKQIAFYKLIDGYLTTKPTEEFITNEKVRIEKELKHYAECFQLWAKNQNSKGMTPKELTSKYNSEMNIHT